jgi:apolipoprotein N-acyltransferase
MEEAAVTRALPLLTTETIYTRFGDVFAFVCLSIALVGAGWEWFSSKRKFSSKQRAVMGGK